MVWTKACEEAFIRAKEVLSSEQLLVYYDPKRPFILIADASPYGIGAVLSHCREASTEQPVEFASRTLNSADKNYAQIEKEGLAIVFGVKRFQLYLFIMTTDHQPLTKSSITSAAARLQRWGVLLSGYGFAITFSGCAGNANVDFFSRFPMQSRDDVDLDSDEHYVCAPMTDELVITAAEIASSETQGKLVGSIKCPR